MIAPLLLLGPLLVPGSLQEESIQLRTTYAQGQKFVVTAELEFVGDPDVAQFFGNAKLRASFDTVVEEVPAGGLTCTSTFRELVGKGNVKVEGKRWNYDLLWKAGSDFRKTVIGHLPAEDAERAAGDLDEAFKTKWTTRHKGFESALTGKTESFSFLKEWVSHLFFLPSPLPFADRGLKKGDAFEAGGLAWTAGEINVARGGSKLAILAGKSQDGAEPRKLVALGVDSRGFVSSYKLDLFEKGAEKPSFHLEGTAERP
jgi:hypothetical protein